MATWALIFMTLVASTSGFRSVCYYTSKAQHRLDIGEFKPQHIDPFLCTHLVYSYAAVTGLSISPSEPNDISMLRLPGTYERLTDLRKANPQLKVLLAVGSVNDTAQAFTQAVSNEGSRNTFARNVTSHIQGIKFDGAHLEWGNLAPRSSPSVDKQKFLLLVKALKKEFKTDLQKDNKAPLILAATLPANKVQIDTAYDIKLLSEELDFVSIATLDMRTAADGKVGLSAPLYSSPNANGSDTYLSVKWVADYYVSRGVKKNKMNIGIPTYGRTFQLKSANQTSIGSDAIGHGHPGPWSKSAGIIGFFEMCNNIRNAGRMTNVPAQHGRYYVNDTQWISYEDILSVLEKTCYVKKELFGGITFWTLDLDDFIGVGCYHDNFPLITTAVNVMKDTNSSLCTTRLNPSKFVNVPAAPSQSTTTPRPVKQTVGGRRVVCYFTRWGQHRGGRATFLPENIDPYLCTHIIYHCANVRNLTIATFTENDESEPWREGLFARVVKLKKEQPTLKVLLSIGGASADYAALEAIVKVNNKKILFSRNVVSYLKERGFDGMELSLYKPPAGFGASRRVLMVRALRAAFEQEARASGNPQLLLTLGMPAERNMIDDGYKYIFPYLIPIVDFFNLMTYNFHVRWNIYTGFNSPLYNNPKESGEWGYENVDWVAKYYASQGLPREKINIGIPTFAATFTLRDSTDNYLLSPTNGSGKPGKYTGTPGILAYYEVCDFIATGATVVKASHQRVSYAVKGDQWVSFESPESVTEKACYTLSNGFGGVNVLAMAYDDFHGDSCGQGVNPLMTTISKIVPNNDQERRCSSVTPSEGGFDDTILGGFRFVCYYSNDAQYRYDIGWFRPHQMDPFLCTHLVYSYAKVTGLSIDESEWNDKTLWWLEGMYARFGNLRKTNPQLKMLLAVGSGSDTAQAFTQAVSTAGSRNTFARNVASYIRGINFDGANLEWGNLAPRSTPSVDKQKFLLLVKALQREFKTDLKTDNKAPLILAATLPAKKDQIDTAYDIKHLSEELDFISIPTLDMRTAADGKVGLSAPLYSSPNATGTDTYLSVKWVADYYVSRGVKRDKINIGIPTYGRTFKLKSATQTSIGSDAIGNGYSRTWMQSPGMKGYFEVCYSITHGGRVTNVPAQHARYYVNGDQWVSYEDIVSVLEKTCYVRQERFGGITFWTLDLDDFMGESCDQNNFPLITTAVNVMKDTSASLCNTRLNPSVFVNVPTAPVQTTTTPRPIRHTVGGRRVVCYFTNWAQYRWGRAKFLPENIDPHVCTHIIYLSANVRDINIATFSENEDSESRPEELFDRVVKLKEKHPHLKVLLSIGGATAEYAALEAIMEEIGTMVPFANNVASYLRERGFDGMELSWYLPELSTDTSVLLRSDLIWALIGAFIMEAEISGNPRLLIAFGLPAGKKALDGGWGSNQFVSIRNYVHHVDLFNLMTYNFHGSWDVYTGFNSPLYTHPSDQGETREYNVDWVARHYMSQGVPGEAINIGIPTFAITFTLSDSRNNSLGSRVNGTGKPGTYTGRSGYLAYYEVCDFIASGASVVNSSYEQVSYAVKGDQWVSFESVESVTGKLSKQSLRLPHLMGGQDFASCQEHRLSCFRRNLTPRVGHACYALRNGFGGVNVWSLDYDDFNGHSLRCGQGVNPLITTISDIMQHIDQEQRCTRNSTLRASTGGSDGTILGKNVLNAHLLLPWLLVIVCVV